MTETQLTVEEVSEALKAARRSLPVFPREPLARMTSTGVGLLHCRVCRSLLADSHSSATSGTLATNPHYECRNCGEVFAWVVRVDRELQKLTAQLLSEPRVIERWRRVRPAELDERIAHGLAIRAWCQAPVNWRRLKRRDRSAFFGGKSAAEDLYHLALRMYPLVRERAGWSGRVRNGSGSLAELARVHDSCLDLELYQYWLRYGGFRHNRQWANAPSRRWRAVQEERHRTADHLWEMLAETRWHDARPPVLPADRQPLSDDWSIFSATRLQDRQDLVRLALGDDTILTIGPDGDLRHESS